MLRPLVEHGRGSWEANAAAAARLTAIGCAAASLRTRDGFGSSRVHLVTRTAAGWLLACPPQQLYPVDRMQQTVSPPTCRWCRAAFSYSHLGCPFCRRAWRCPGVSTARVSVTGVNSPTSGLVPVHVGQPGPGSQRREQLLAERLTRTMKRPARVPAGLAWQQHGVEPRWFGMETSDCAAAIEPSSFHNHGDELDRFLAGARRRGELALVVTVIGDVTDDGPRYPLSRVDASVQVSKMFTSIGGRRLPVGTRPEIVSGLRPADRDLAIRLRTRPVDAPWWGLHLSGVVLERGDGSGSEEHKPDGKLHPILVDDLRNPVVAAWTPPSGDERWYVLPDATDWDNVLDWLVQRALPEYVPAALRRARAPHLVDPDLQTADELAARHALDELEALYAEEKLRLQGDLRHAESTAEPIRYGLLYGTGAELVAAVATVLTAAGLTVIDLDTALGGTRSADLLVSAGSRRRLIEVKAASGPAQESLVGHLQRHLDTWPQLRPDEPVTGGVLVVNHQHKRHPSERTARVYSRPEFVDGLTVPVISTIELFNWWRTSDSAAIRNAALGAEQTTTDTALAAPTAPTPAVPTAPSPRRRRWWQGAARTE